jgi:peptide/nickel transport system permease protein
MKYIIKRLATSILLLSGIVIINFSLFFLSPGDPTNLYFSPRVKKSVLEQRKKEMGLDKSYGEQLYHWLDRFVRGDLGYSWAKHRPVLEVLAEAIPATLQLTVLALVVNFVLGLLVGILAGIKQHHWFSKIIDTASLIIYSIPVFLLALFLVTLFSLKFHLFPASGMNSLAALETGFWPRLWDRLMHLVLPVLILGITGAAATSRYVKERVNQICRQDYIKFAFAKGLTHRRIYFNHISRDALLPVVTLLGLYFPFLLGSTFIVEVIFAWPGMGRTIYDAIFSKDYPVIMAVNLIAGIMVIAGNMIADLLYRIIDPRIRRT